MMVGFADEYSAWRFARDSLARSREKGA